MRLAIVLSLVLLWAAPGPQVDGRLDSVRERARVLAAADRYLKNPPVTVTASASPRSAGGPAFAHYTGNETVMRECRTRFKTVLVQQMAADGSFPRELGRTKPYGYSLFNLEAMGTICQIRSTPEDDLWAFELPDGRGMRRAVA